MPYGMYTCNTYAYTYAYAYVYVYMYMYTHTYVYVYVYVYIYVRIRMRIHFYVLLFEGTTLLLSPHRSERIEYIFLKFPIGGKYWEDMLPTTTCIPYIEINLRMEGME